MNRTKLVVAALIVVFVGAALFSFCGCAPVSDPGNNGYSSQDGYETVDGFYRVHVYEVEDTCYPIVNEEDRVNHNSWLSVLVQDEREDGGYLVDIVLADLYWYDAEVAPDGDLDAVTDVYGTFFYYIDGLLLPDEIVAIIDLDAVDRNGDLMCRITYEIDGFALFPRNPPPDGFYSNRNALEFEDRPELDRNLDPFNPVNPYTFSN